jgi:hypothetical protein
MGGETQSGILALVDSYNYLITEEFLDIPADKRETILVHGLNTGSPLISALYMRTAEMCRCVV